VIAAPPPPDRELVCRDGLKYYARIPERNIRAALGELSQQQATLRGAQPGNTEGAMLQQELEIASRMAFESGKIMLWQQALAAGKTSLARKMAAAGIRQLTGLEKDFNALWPLRNKGTPVKCSPFFRWRIQDYRAGRLHFAEEQARPIRPPPQPAA
jgi:hypothetical protein